MQPCNVGVMRSLSHLEFGSQQAELRSLCGALLCPTVQHRISAAEVGYGGMRTARPIGATFPDGIQPISEKYCWSLIFVSIENWSVYQGYEYPLSIHK